MLKWILIFLVLSIITGSVGFSAIAVSFALIAKVLFALFAIGFVISLIMHIMGSGSPKP
ncbi:MAG: hypothetical protein K0R49_229 [Burkholderiales bacterium]|jgi:uncharacterized membrane protein YtjA (UPF0391 family)|nr:hypothetical protein [Burkholderiales bacterium]MCE3267977.1 hypothetical protein [Burkholderiales bacterium]